MPITTKVLFYINLDEWEQISYLADTLKIELKKSAEALEKYDFDEEKAIDFLTKQMHQEAAAKNKKKDKEKEKKK